MNNDEQINYWNGEAGEKWVKMSQQLDELLAPFIPEILTRAALQPNERVLDIGCGGGALTLEAAKSLGNLGEVSGVDVSTPLLDFAQQRARKAAIDAAFLCEDASQYRAEQKFDCAISRFGVMFFSDPTEAFTSLRQNLNQEGRLVFACWQPLALNDWANFALQEALPYLNEVPAMASAGTPGPFAFADRTYLENVLSNAGWQNIDIEPWSGKLKIPSDTPEGGADFLLKIGPAARALAEQDVDVDAIRASITDRIKATIKTQGSAEFSATAWLVTAKAT
jgi:ubiquinone/menaquinone biosynthesis C-methylase UbiE